MAVPMQSTLGQTSLVTLEGVTHVYGANASGGPALDAVSFSIGAGETVAVIGESGSGKSTLARILAGLLPVTRGTIRLRGETLAGTTQHRSSDLLRRIQIIFQNPGSSLNPRHRVSTIIGRPLQHFFGLSGAALADRVETLLGEVRLPGHYGERYPSELSGGERQRVAIARALAAEPDLLICDEGTSALDVSVEGALLSLLKDVQKRTGVSMLFITHDLALARWFADRAIVLFRGTLCEDTAIPELYERPRHPYTASLIEAVPSIARSLT